MTALTLATPKFHERQKNCKSFFVPKEIEKDKVMNWLKKNDPSLSKVEIQGFEEAIDEFMELSSNKATFYGKKGQVNINSI